MKKTNYPIGSISSGTMRNEDLIPDFTWELKCLAKQHGNGAHLTLVHEIDKRMAEDGCYESEDADYDLEELFDALNEYAGPYFYFGAHPGDGADYGFWLSQDCIEDFDGLTVHDTSEIPKDYAGEILHINDHGNLTLYHKAKTQPAREVWAVA